MPAFRLHSEFEPTGDQPTAIRELVAGLESGDRDQTLLGVTGSGKTFTIAKVIESVQRPTLIIAPNKTLAAQLFNEYREFFPDNAVEFFVSYYDYYQPEAYVPSSDTYIEKDANINDAIDRMRHATTHSLLTRNDVIIVASVSCIYGLGTSEAYIEMMVHLERGHEIDRDDLLRRLVTIQYERSHVDFHRGTFRVQEWRRGRGLSGLRELERCAHSAVWRRGRGHLRGGPSARSGDPWLDKIAIFPASHYVVTPDRRQFAIDAIRRELAARLSELRTDGQLLEAQRLDQRTSFDLEMMVTMGYCNGIENYARHLTGRAPGEPPPCLLSYFASDYLLVIDESHVSVPQIGGMYRGDRSRKQTLVEYGFRFPSALDNRPLNFEEFESLVNQVIYVSATPGAYEIERSQGVVVEQIIRPTGLLDPAVEVRPAADQVDDAIHEIRVAVETGGRVLVTTLTKRMAEDLTEFLSDIGMAVRYLHSDIDTLERTAILRDLRKGEFDILVGINLLREGLDLPEVVLVVILDADKEGFLRSRRSLIQTIGRASRNVAGRVLLYADTTTNSITEAVGETARRREIQHQYNQVHDITPRTIIKPIHDIEDHVPLATERAEARENARAESNDDAQVSEERIPRRIRDLTKSMKAAAESLDFELAAVYRDRIKALEDRALGLAGSG